MLRELQLPWAGGWGWEKETGRGWNWRGGGGSVERRGHWSLDNRRQSITARPLDPHVLNPAAISRRPDTYKLWKSFHTERTQPDRDTNNTKLLVLDLTEKLHIWREALLYHLHARSLFIVPAVIMIPCLVAIFLSSSTALWCMWWFACSSIECKSDWTILKTSIMYTKIKGLNIRSIKFWKIEAVA